jgi:Ca-activated chloride channel family protein
MAESLGLTFRSMPLLALAALVPAALVFLIARERHRIRLGRRFVSERLRGVANPARVLRPYLIAAALLSAVVALAGPRAGFTIMPLEERETNRVLAIDVSLSMAAEDVGTSRLDAAKAIAKRIIAADPGRVGVVIFEAGAEVVSPLTTDDDAVSALVDSIQPGELSEPGSDLGAGLVAAQRLLESDPGQKGDIVVISDGEDQGSHLDDAIARVRAHGIPVSTVAIGSPGGSKIRRPEGGGDLRDDSGEVVWTYLHPETLERVARQTGGRPLVNPFSEHALDALVTPGVGAVRQKNVRMPVERYQWPLALACLALLCGSFVNRGAE